MRNNIDNSSVFKDFVKIAESYGWVKEADDPDVIKNKYNTTDETGAELIDKAHPDEVWVAEALGEGGLVENQNEQHDKLISILYKAPEGSLLGRHAQLVTSLKKTAGKAYLKGDISSYNMINNSIESLNDNVYKKTAGFFGFAAGFLVNLLGMATVQRMGGRVTNVTPGKGAKYGMLAAIVAFATGLLSKLTSIQETVPKDLDDMLKHLNLIISDPDYKEIHATAKLVTRELEPWVGKFDKEVPVDDKGNMTSYLEAIKKFQVALGGDMSSNVQEIDSKSHALSGGLDKPGRLISKFNSLIDAINSLDQTISKSLELSGNKKVVETITKEYAGPVRKPGILGLLERAGYSTKEGILSALTELEDNIIGKYPNKANKIKGKLTDPSKPISESGVEQILKVLEKS